MAIWFSKIEPNKLFFININGLIKCLYTPFQVQCINPSGDIKPFSIVYVEAVYSSKEGILIYFINQQVHYYWHFMIIAKF